MVEFYFSSRWGFSTVSLVTQTCESAGDAGSCSRCTSLLPSGMDRSTVAKTEPAIVSPAPYFSIITSIWYPKYIAHKSRISILHRAEVQS